VTISEKSRLLFLPMTASLGKGSDTMSGTYEKDFISEPEISLIGAVHAADATIFSMQTALWWQGMNEPERVAKWKRSAFQNLRKLEQAVADMRLEVEALPDESTLNPVTLPNGDIVL
jgi:hypothetical protein